MTGATRENYTNNVQNFGQGFGVDSNLISSFGLESITSLTNNEEIQDRNETQILSCLIPALYYNKDVDAYDGLISQISKFCYTSIDRRSARCNPNK